MAEVLDRQPVAARRATLPPSMLPRRRAAEWSPTLGTGDLACLLQVIEKELLPRLVSAYAPSTHSPLPTSGRD